jgi:LysR family transcriptional regulator for bpeEF and oprC
MPQRPRDLERHRCLVFRTPSGTVIDLWKFERDSTEESAAVNGWLVSDNLDVLIGMAIAGEGVVRLSEVCLREGLASGRLAPALPGWQLRDVPLVNLLYRPNARQIARVRAFLDFVAELFQKPDAARPPGSMPAPRWYRRAGRASAALRGPG